MAIGTVTYGVRKIIVSLMPVNVNRHFHLSKCHGNFLFQQSVLRLLSLRKGCTVIKKSEVYESHLFTVKDDKFKSEPFLREVKAIYTDLINRHISDLEQQLKVFDKNSVYLPTKKIGMNNPKAAEIKADNTARQEWNRTADMALLSGISEAKILEVKQTEIHEKASQSIKSKGWLPNLFRGIVAKAKDFLQNLIREKDMLPKPTLDIDCLLYTSPSPRDCS